MRTLHRVTSTLAVLLLLLAITAVPALAAVSASATITSGDLLSGQGDEVVIRIQNTGSEGGLLDPGDSEINAVQIEAPNGIFDTGSVVLPDGWEGGYDAEIGFVYATASQGNELAHGAVMEFTLQGTAVRIEDDDTQNVPVFVSDDGGMTLHSAGAPSVTSRIFEVVGSTVVKPVDATNTDATQVTQDQANADIEVTVINHGKFERSVDVGVTQDGGSSSVVAPDTNVDIPGNDTPATVTLDAEFGDAGTLGLDATATSTNSTAKPFDMATITVQPKFGGTYVPDSLSPQVAVQGDDVAFSLNVNKAGAQPTDTDVTFSFPGFSVDMEFDFGGGNANNVDLTFPSETIDETLDNGEFTTALDVDGTDGNGAIIDATLLPDAIILDNLAPVVTLIADVGPSEVSGADPAAGDGRDITFSGSVQLGPDADADPCGNDTCSVQRAVVVTSTGDELPFTLNIDAQGNLSGVDSFTFPEGTTAARAEATIVKTNGLTNDGQSDTFDVDLITPFIQQALTQRDDEAGEDSILITFNELVDASATTASDWQVDNNFVSVDAVTPVGDASSTNQIILELSQQFEDRNATPTVSYAQALLNDPVFDRVALNLLDQAIEAVDGITPELPVIDSVAGLPLQDDEFWTNQARPTITVSNLVPGDVLKLYWDRDDDGVRDADELLTSGAVSSETQEFDLDEDLADSEQAHDLIAVAFDEADNASELAVEVLNYDLTLAEIIAFEANGNQVTAVFSEPVPRGRDAAFDWTVIAVQDGQEAHRTVTSVEVVSGTERLLNVAESSYDPARGDVVGVRYKFRGAEADRYEDRATNGVGDHAYRE